MYAMSTIGLSKYKNQGDIDIKALMNLQVNNFIVTNDKYTDTYKLLVQEPKSTRGWQGKFATIGEFSRTFLHSLRS